MNHIVKILPCQRTIDYQQFVDLCINNFWKLPDTEINCQEPGLSAEFINRAMLNLESENAIVDSIVISLNNYSIIRSWRVAFDENIIRRIYNVNVYGYLFSSEIRISSKIPDSHILLISYNRQPAKSPKRSLGISKRFRIP